MIGSTSDGAQYYGVNGMVTSGQGNTDEQLNARRPKPVFFWTNGEVMKWLKRCCEEYYELYGNIFLENEITGRSLIRINEETLKRMGVENGTHRDEIARIILKLKLKSDIIEIKDLERKIQTPATNQVSNSFSSIR